MRSGRGDGPGRPRGDRALTGVADERPNWAMSVKRIAPATSRSLPGAALCKEVGGVRPRQALQLRLDEGQNIRVRRNAGAEGIWGKLDPHAKAVLHRVGDPRWAVATVQLNAAQHEQPPRLLRAQDRGLVDHG